MSKIPNCITFNGVITTDLIKLENEEYGFVLRGPNNEEFPLIVIKAEGIKNIDDYLRKGDNISAVGILKKKSKDWIIKVDTVMRIPTEEEVNNLN